MYLPFSRKHLRWGRGDADLFCLGGSGGLIWLLASEKYLVDFQRKCNHLNFEVSLLCILECLHECVYVSVCILKMFLTLLPHRGTFQLKDLTKSVQLIVKKTHKVINWLMNKFTYWISFIQKCKTSTYSFSLTLCSNNATLSSRNHIIFLAAIQSVYPLVESSQKN